MLQHNRVFLSKVFLMVGGEERARLVANTFLKNPKYLENIEGLNFFCGKYKNKYISILVHESNISSVDICSRFLFSNPLFKPALVIRISFCIPLNNFQILGVKNNFYLASKVFCHDHAYEKDMFYKNITIEEIDSKLQNNIFDKAKYLNIKLKPTSIYTISSYHPNSFINELAKKLSFDCIDMDSSCLYRNASFYKKTVVSLFLVSDNNVWFNDMNESLKNFKDITFLALETALRYT